MKKRIASLLIALVMLVSVIPAGIFNVHAASSMITSDECLEILKMEEGFCKKPVWDYTQYTVGYGSRCPDDMVEYYTQHGITKAEAEILLRNYLGAIERDINKRIIDRYGLNLSQNQFDALILFSYNCGTGWTYDASSTFHQAIATGAKGNELIRSFALWCNAGNQVRTYLLRRRLSESNMYINGIYDITPPSNYCYVYYDANGGTTSPRSQGYDSNLYAAPYPVPVYEGHTFAGWYTQRDGGEKVTVLTADLKGCTLYAHWTDGNGDPVQGETPDRPDPVKVTMLDTEVRVRSGPGTNYEVVGYTKKGDQFLITETATGSGYLWGKYEGGWIALMYTDYDEVIKNQGGTDDPDPTEPTQPTEPKPTEPKPTEPTKPEVEGVKVTVITTDVNLRAGPGTNYDVINWTTIGAEFVITETAEGSGYLWGKFDGGWIALKFTNYDEVIKNQGGTDEPTEPTEPTQPTEPTEPTKPEAEGIKVTVITTDVNLRAGPGTNYDVIGWTTIGEEFVITEAVMATGYLWGKFDGGWIALKFTNYDEMLENQVTPPKPTDPTDPTEPTQPTEPTEPTQPTEPKPTEPTKPEVEGVKVTVITTDVNLRAGPGTNYDVINWTTIGAEFVITETAEGSGYLWGKFDGGWIALKFTNYDEVIKNQGGTDDPDPTDPTEPTDPEPTDPTEPTDPEPTDPKPTVTMWKGKVIKVDELRIRTGPGTGYSTAGYLRGGTIVTITERKINSAGEEWCKIANGWVSMEYIEIVSTYEEEVNNSVVTGTVKVTDFLRVRTGPGLSYPIAGYLMSNTKVTITERKTVDGMTWGKIDKGWISMDYVVLDEDDKPAGNPSGTPNIKTVIAVYLNVRSGPGTNYSVISYLYYGRKVEITEIKTANDGSLWGNIGNGWVYMDYLA